MKAIAFSNTTRPLPSSQVSWPVWRSEIDFQCPHLKLFRGHGLVKGLLDDDEIDQPKGAPGLGGMVDAFGEENVAFEPVAIPGLGTGETVHDLGCKLRGVWHLGLLRFLLFMR